MTIHTTRKSASISNQPTSACPGKSTMNRFVTFLSLTSCLLFGGASIAHAGSYGKWSGTDDSKGFKATTHVSGTEAPDTKAIYTLAVFPGAESSAFGYFEMMDRYLPFAQFLTIETGSKINIVPIRIPDMAMKSLMKGKYDLFFGPPVFAAKASSDAKYSVLTREEESIKAVFVVLKDSPIKSLQDLKASDTIATPPSHLLLSILTKETLSEKGMSADQAVPVSVNQSALLTALNAGTHKVAVLRDKAAQKLFSQEPGKYRIIGETIAAPGFTLIAGPNVDADFKTRLVAAVMRLQQSSKVLPGEAAAWKGLNVARFVDAKGADYVNLNKTMAHWEHKKPVFESKVLTVAQE